MSSTSIHEAPRRSTLDELAARARWGDAVASAEFCQRMQTSLGPIVRLAVRRGEGLQPVVRWVRRMFATIADGRAMPDEQYTAEITQLLCAELLRAPATAAASTS